MGHSLDFGLLPRTRILPSSSNPSLSLSSTKLRSRVENAPVGPRPSVGLAVRAMAWKPWGGSTPSPEYGQGQAQWQQQETQRQPVPQPPVQPQSQSLPGGLVVEKLLTVETNIDDMSPQIMAFASQKLLDAGALDVWTTPALMKKGRPGMVLHALCSQETVNSVMTVIFYETTSLGVRIVPCDRVSMQRLVESVSTLWGFVPVKAAFINGQLVTATAEYEACAEIARANNVPLKMVKAAAENAYVESEARERQALER